MTGVQTCALPISLFADDMILYIENPKDATGKLLELINESGKVPGYKINAQKSLAFLHTNDVKSERESMGVFPYFLFQKSLAFLHTNDVKSERESKETLPFTIATKRIKYQRTNLPKETKDRYAENYKTLMKEIKDDTDRERDRYTMFLD